MVVPSVLFWITPSRSRVAGRGAGGGGGTGDSGCRSIVSGHHSPWWIRLVMAVRSPLAMSRELLVRSSVLVGSMQRLLDPAISRTQLELRYRRHGWAGVWHLSG